MLKLWNVSLACPVETHFHFIDTVEGDLLVLGQTMLVIKEKSPNASIDARKSWISSANFFKWALLQLYLLPHWPGSSDNLHPLKHRVTKLSNIWVAILFVSCYQKGELFWCFLHFPSEQFANVRHFSTFVGRDHIKWLNGMGQRFLSRYLIRTALWIQIACTI